MSSIANIAAMARQGFTDDEIAETLIADREAAGSLAHDDSEWADRQRGFGASDSLTRNDAGEWLGFM